MKITIESTATITTIDGVPVRHWKGVTEQGVPCEVFVHRIAVGNEHDQVQFDAALAAQREPDEFLSFGLILEARQL